MWKFLVGNMKNTLLYCVIATLWLIPCIGAHGRSTGVESLGMKYCTSASETQLKLFEFDQATRFRQCECVSKRKNGVLPVDKSEWFATGQGSTSQLLIECSERDIVEFYKRAVKRAAGQRLKAEQKTNHEIDRFGSCVALGAYRQMHQVASGEKDGLDKLGFKSLYRSCEASIN